MRQKSVLILLPYMRPPQMSHPRLEPSECVRQAPGVGLNQRHVFTKFLSDAIASVSVLMSVAVIAFATGAATAVQ